MADVIYQRRTIRDLARVLRQPADSCLFSGGLETKPTKIQASGGRKPPDSGSIDDRGLCLCFTRQNPQRRIKQELGNRRAFHPNLGTEFLFSLPQKLTSPPKLGVGPNKKESKKSPTMQRKILAKTYNGVEMIYLMKY